MNVDKLVSEFETADFRTRRELAKSVLNQAIPKDLHSIARLLVHPSQNVRLGAIEVLGEARYRPALNILVDVTRKRTGDERTFAAGAVAKMVLAEDMHLKEVAVGWLEAQDDYLPIHGAAILEKLGEMVSRETSESRHLRTKPSLSLSLTDELEALEQARHGGAQLPAAKGTFTETVGGPAKTHGGGRLQQSQGPSPKTSANLGGQLSRSWPLTGDEQRLHDQIDMLPLTLDAQRHISSLWKRVQRTPVGTPAREQHIAYLRVIKMLPWAGDLDRHVATLDAVEQALDASHIGLRAVKERLLERVAVRSLRHQAGRPLCLVSPPGCGRTSLLRSFMSAVQKPVVYLRFASDDNESIVTGIRDHAPGSVIKSLIRSGSASLAVVIQDIDGVPPSSRLSYALEQTLTIEGRKKFVDNYLRVEFDLSDVDIFCTARDVNNIAPELARHLQLVRLPDYARQERVDIVKQRLLPSALMNNGLSEDDIDVAASALESLVDATSETNSLLAVIDAVERLCARVALEKCRRGHEFTSYVVDEDVIARLCSDVD